MTSSLSSCVSLLLLSSCALSREPSADAGRPEILKIQGFTYYTCALRSSGTIACWGWGTGDVCSDLAGPHVSGPAVTLPGVSDAVDFATAAGEVCAVRAGGAVACWKFNGEVGAMEPVEGVEGARRIAAGLEHFCAIVADGSVSCWGENYYGQVGVGTTATPLAATRVPGVHGAVEISLGGLHSCALLDDGSALCWGWNHSDRIDLTILEGMTIVGVNAAGIHTCFETEEHSFLCLGREGPLSAEPAVRSASISAASGWDHECRLVGGRIVCWGNNGIGQLAENPETIVSGSSDVEAIDDAVLLGGGMYHTCALRSSGSIWCWGWNWCGQLGTDADETLGWRPAPVTVL